jgi:hypothetical protein
VRRETRISVHLRLPRRRRRICRDRWHCPGRRRLRSVRHHFSRRPILRRRSRRGRPQRIVWNYRHRRKWRIVCSSDWPEHRRNRAVRGQIMERPRNQPLGGETNGIKNVGHDSDGLRILVGVFLGVLTVVVVVLRVRKSREPKHQRGAETNCCSPHVINLSDSMRPSQPAESCASRLPAACLRCSSRPCLAVSVLASQLMFSPCS